MQQLTRATELYRSSFGVTTPPPGNKTKSRRRIKVEMSFRDNALTLKGMFIDDVQAFAQFLDKIYPLYKFTANTENAIIFVRREASPPSGDTGAENAAVHNYIQTNKLLYNFYVSHPRFQTSSYMIDHLPTKKVEIRMSSGVVFELDVED